MKYEKAVKLRPEALEDRVVEFFDKNNRFLGQLRQNPRGNRYLYSYTFVSYNGGEVLLPSGFVDHAQNPAVSNTMRFRIGEDGTVYFRNLKPDAGNSFEVWDHLDELSGEKSPEVPLGGDGMLEGMLDSGSFVVSTRREAGEVKEHYEEVNEDTCRVNRKQGRLVVVDGVGGYRDGHCVSHFGARCLANYDGPLPEACSFAGRLVDEYVQHYPESEKGDAVYAAMEVHGDRAELASAGDSHWLVVRDGKVVAKSPVRTAAHDLYAADVVQEHQLYDDPDIAPLTGSYTSSFRTDQPSFASHDLKEGDVVVLLSDGADALTEREIAALVTGRSAKDAHDELLAIVAERNKNGTYLRAMADGIECFATAPRDNVTIGVYVHKKPLREGEGF